MDTSYWISLNQKVNILESTKVYFKEFTCKAKYYCPGGMYLREQSQTHWGEPLVYVDMRKETYRRYKQIGSWAPAGREFESINSTQLEKTRIALGMYDEMSFKFRVEEPYFALYTTNEQDLKTLVSRIDCNNRIHEVSVPHSTQASEDLKNNIIYRKRDVGYQYRVTVRDRYKRDTVSITFKNYLDNLGIDTVKISRTVARTLSKGRFSQVWFYSNDLTFLPMLELIYPSSILKVETIEII